MEGESDEDDHKQRQYVASRSEMRHSLSKHAEEKKLISHQSAEHGS